MFWKNNRFVARWSAYFIDDAGQKHRIAKSSELNELEASMYNRIERLTNRITLLENHLNLKYVPETETKEPAKLVEKSRNKLYPGAIVGFDTSSDLEDSIKFMFTQPKEIFEPKNEAVKKKIRKLTKKK